MSRNIMLVLMGLFIASPVMAKEFTYQGKISGMSCAFCVYKLSKKIKSLPGVDKKSVKVSLKTGLMNFRSSNEVKPKEITALFSDTGFSLSEFKAIKSYQTATYKKTTLVSMNLSSIELDDYKALLKKLGDIAANELGKLEISAPKSIEIPLLKIMIMGRKKVARVKFIEAKDKAIKISIYQKK
ncbi:hypothetical protein MNBD_GAMMA12-1693 [hydrothermal vent metagenome]|uniref:HMA domain-containing protein n=1 Tax=hydrothermal vent metagenome TaxID=652676 RepID=A0A3B0YDM6_9ZZZZ